MATDAGHVFISYVHENSDEVDRIERMLKAARISVWRDKDALWPGEDWRDKIREAITEGALVFLACISDESIAKKKSYQREELILAVEEYRLRNPAVPWLIPVRLSDCKLPSYNLGAGRDLDSLHHPDLFGDRWEDASYQLVAAVMRAFGRAEAPSGAGGLLDTSPEARVKGALLDPTRQIELDEYVADVANTASVTLADAELFPSTNSILNDNIEGVRYLAAQVDRYWTIVDPLARILIAGGAWGRPQHDSIWTRAMERVANVAKDEGGQSALINLRRFPAVPLLYATAISAVHRSNLGPLKAVAVDARFRTDRRTLPFIAEGNIYVPLGYAGVTSDVLALEADGVEVNDDVIRALENGRKGKRYTPVSDLLHARLRPLFSTMIADDDDYSDTFDRTEVLLGVLAADQEQQMRDQQVWTPGPWFGRFTWRDRFVQTTLEDRLSAEMQGSGTNWPPLSAGFFDGDVARATAAFNAFIQGAQDARRHRF